MYLAVYGDEFLKKVDEIWGDAIEVESEEEQDTESTNLVPKFINTGGSLLHTHRAEINIMVFLVSSKGMSTQYSSF